MKLIKYITIGSALVAAFVGTSRTTLAVPLVDVIDATTGQAGTFFVPTDAQKFDAPYYRGQGEDWGWHHNPIADPYTSATLSISAFDVDAPSEVDVISIFASGGGAPILLGSLAGANDVWSYTSFDVTALAAEIAAGLSVWMEIDTATSGLWLVTLAKSVLTLDGAAPPPPPPPGVPDAGATALLLCASAAGLSVARKLSRK